MKKYIFLGLKSLLAFLGYDLRIYNLRAAPNKDINLNIGAGGRQIPNFLSLDKFSLSYYSSLKTFEKHRIAYDIRADSLPFENNEVANIYVSHVLEHIEDVYIEKFLSEAFRVLKPKAVLRIVSPDAEFLHRVSSFDNEYWSWRKDWANNPRHSSHTEKNYSQWDYFLAETLTPRMKFYRNYDNQEEFDYNQLKDDFRNVLQNISSIKYRDEFPQDHINFIFFEKIRGMGSTAGFSEVVNSKCQGSVSAAMQGPFFDQKAPQMSLYIDLVK